MGYGTRPGTLGHTIRTFHPDDTENEFYIAHSATLEEIMTRCREKWGDNVLMDAASITIHPEHIHTDCLGYDLYDSGDYTYFLRIERST